MDSRHQRHICQIVHKFFTKFKKIYKIHTKLLQPEGTPPGTPVHTRPQAKRNGAGLSRRKKRREQRLCSTLGQPARPPTSSPSLLCSRTCCTTRRWTRSLGEQAAYAAPSREAVGNGGGDHEAEVIRLVLYRRLREDGRGESNAIRWQKKTVEMSLKSTGWPLARGTPQQPRSVAVTDN